MAKKPTAKAKTKTKTPAKKTAAPTKKPAPKTTLKSAPKATAPVASSSKALPPHYLKGQKSNGVAKPRNTRSYTMSELIENVRGYCSLARRSDAKEICLGIEAFLTDSLKKGYKIPLLGLGKLYVRESKARQGRNPQTGAVVNIPARKRVRFSASKALKERVL